jgi:uncharacterized protein (DUF1330 family)
MARGYWIVRVSVHDQDRYPEYLAAAQVAFKKYGAKFIVRGGAYESMEGTSRERNVVVEFDDRATAVACYRSPEYRAARCLRQKYADSDFVVVEGVEAIFPTSAGSMAARKGGLSLLREKFNEKPTTYTANHKNLDSYADHSPPRRNAIVNAVGILRRVISALLEAMEGSRRRQAEREIARYVALRGGGRMTDEFEREITRHLFRLNP